MPPEVRFLKPKTTLPQIHQKGTQESPAAPATWGGGEDGLDSGPHRVLSSLSAGGDLEGLEAGGRAASAEAQREA